MDQSAIRDGLVLHHPFKQRVRIFMAWMSNYHGEIRLVQIPRLDIPPDLLYSFAILGAGNADGDLSGLCRGILAAG
jgi:hypothetical protein